MEKDLNTAVPEEQVEAGEEVVATETEGVAEATETASANDVEILCDATNDVEVAGENAGAETTGAGEEAEVDADEAIDSSEETAIATVETEEVEAPAAPKESKFMEAAKKAMGNGAKSLKKAATEMSQEQSFKASELAFISDTVMTLSPANFERLRNALTEDCIKFWYVPKENVTPEILAEKLYDHFLKTYAVTGVPFEKQVFQYIKSVSDLVDSHVEEVKEAVDGTEVASRARQFYENAQEIKASRSASTKDILEFSRLMFCLYAATLHDRLNKIQDFEYSATVINPEEIVDSMKKETTEAILGIKHKVFSLEGTYSQDISTMIIAMVSLYKIVEDCVE